MLKSLQTLFSEAVSAYLRFPMFDLNFQWFYYQPLIFIFILKFKILVFFIQFSIKIKNEFIRSLEIGATFARSTKE